ncbi:FAD-dependent oxidoreductase [Paracoccus laeviglucosivorans]|uniref:Glycine/D-amino acid oxidase n=1 Tax=Paracoccus laeviglucosivorans TaxID=1197861 RepID=A0A521E3D2_9RHOB|nr:FAD-dependent oxidoreductase [Paracoccus laeviglucosivorans]SMO78467.1 Glycine/D-amino acid oxidase [Paracoccus laeviglucosivorans]
MNHVASMPRHVDALIVGGGFFGLCLALFLRSVTRSLLLVETRPQLMDRASRVNQARVHTGFHYPRSALTAGRSLSLHRRFADDFPEAIHDRFDMAYAIASQQSKVTARRFYRMFADMGAPIAVAGPQLASLFDRDRIAGIFACTEYAFDYTRLRDQLAHHADAAGIEIRLGTSAIHLAPTATAACVTLSDGTEVIAKHVFDVTYSRINHLRVAAGLPLLALKHEAAEVALVVPPPELERVGVTVMDGPFFSTMPYPAAGLHSLTHVRYTPGASWTDDGQGLRQHLRYDVAAPQVGSRARFMVQDAARFLPVLAGAEWRSSIHEVKTVLLRNEGDDARPILYRRDPGAHLTSILGAKLDNIYDLFDQVRLCEPRFAKATDRLITASGKVAV